MEGPEKGGQVQFRLMLCGGRQFTLCAAFHRIRSCIQFTFPLPEQRLTIHTRMREGGDGGGERERVTYQEKGLDALDARLAITVQEFD